MKKSKKGISPLIASVLLIAFTVAIATLIMGWFSTITRSTTTTVGNKTSESVACSSAQISIEDIYIRQSLFANVTVIVKNTGYATIGINSLQIYNTTGQNFSTGFIAATSLPPGSIVTYNLTLVIADELKYTPLFNDTDATGDKRKKILLNPIAVL